jgi:hypothetical protein
LVQSREQIINKIILIAFGSFWQGVQNQWPFVAKSVIIALLHEIDGQVLGIASAGEEANIASDLIK